MSNYLFAPSPNFGMSEHPFTTWDGAFNAEEIKRITAIGEALAPKNSKVDDNVDPDTCIRVSETSWIANNDDSLWLYDRLGWVARQLNGQFYQFDLHGFCEDFQYTVYRGAEENGGHYTWHRDSGGRNLAPRKLSMVVQLSDPSEYEGGDLQIMSSAEPTVVDKALGKIVAFPSFMMHRVTPVTKGVRRTLVAWITGPSFK